MIVAVFNQKGGPGKTTTTLSLAAGLLKLRPEIALRLIDLDWQESLTMRREAIPAAEWRATDIAGLKEALAGTYDHALIDCPTNIHEARERATIYAAADLVLIPVEAEYDATVALIRTAGECRAIGKPFRAVLTKYAASVPVCREARDAMHAEVTAQACTTIIPFSRKFGAAAAQNITIFQHAPDSLAARAYEKLAREFLTWPLQI